MRIEFVKMHGAKNDFVVLHDLENSIPISGDQASKLCDRRSGVGADGVIIVRASEKADFFMDYINADGTVAEMCGNGIRCLAKYVYDSGLTKKTALPVETRAGIKVVELALGADNRVEAVRVDMGEPIFEPEQIPLLLQGEKAPILNHEFESNGRKFTAGLVSMGNPHCVILTDGAQDEDLHLEFGPHIEKHPLFPRKTNVEFVRILDSGTALMNVWERGSGETFACGTGACAVAVVGVLKGVLDNRSTIRLKGGDLDIEWNGMGYPVFMTGPAVSVFKGIINI
jgi:diaminopimelate epimerase